MMVCAHCLKPSGPKRDWAGGDDLLRLQCQRSADSHAQNCSLPVRQPLRRTGS